MTGASYSTLLTRTHMLRPSPEGYTRYGLPQIRSCRSILFVTAPSLREASAMHSLTCAAIPYAVSERASAEAVLLKLLKPMKTAVKISRDTPSNSTYSVVTAIPWSLPVLFNFDNRISNINVRHLLVRGFYRPVLVSHAEATFLQLPYPGLAVSAGYSYGGSGKMQMPYHRAHG